MADVDDQLETYVDHRLFSAVKYDLYRHYCAAIAEKFRCATKAPRNFERGNRRKLRWAKRDQEF